MVGLSFCSGALRGARAFPAVVALLFSSAAFGDTTSSAAASSETHPINCSTAEGDLRALESEKKHARKQQVENIEALIPAGALLGIAQGREKEKLQMLAGDYVRKIDQRMAQIKAQCGD